MLLAKRPIRKLGKLSVCWGEGAVTKSLRREARRRRGPVRPVRRFRPEEPLIYRGEIDNRDYC